MKFYSGFLSVAFFLALSTNNAFAGACWNFVNDAPKNLGPVKLMEQPSTVCIYHKSTIIGGQFHVVRFFDREGYGLDYFKAELFAVGKCFGICRYYELEVTDGVHPDAPRINLVSPNGKQGTFTVIHPGSKRTYAIEAAASNPVF